MEFLIASRRWIFCESLVIISALSLPGDNPSHHKRFGWDKNPSCFVFCFFLPATVMHNELLGRAIEFLIRLGIYFFASFLPEPTSFWPILCLVIIRITTDAHTRITTDGPLQLRWSKPVFSWGPSDGKGILRQLAYTGVQTKLWNLWSVGKHELFFQFFSARTHIFFT